MVCRVCVLKDFLLHLCLRAKEYSNAKRYLSSVYLMSLENNQLIKSIIKDAKLIVIVDNKANIKNEDWRNF